MATNTNATSSSISTITSMVTDPGNLITITQDEFNMFHNIDRKLFSRLITNLDRDPIESMQVIALFIWLERIDKDSWIVYNLLAWPDHLLNDLINEALMVLSCVKGENFPFSNAMYDLPLTQKLTHSGINLIFFHENRHDILPVVMKLLSDVCIRAFNDIIQKAQHEKASTEKAPLEKMMTSERHNLNHILATNTNQNLFGMNLALQMGYYNQRSLISPLVKPITTKAEVVPNHRMSGMAAQLMLTQSQVNNGVSYDWIGIKNFDPPYQKDFLNNGPSEFLDGLKLNDGGNNAQVVNEVHPDDRTIFVTFSKGYPISKSEVLDYFTRRYGDIIEAVHMQEVAPLEQPLYARLVVRPTAIHMIRVILQGMTRNKFNINGKHVWARKYVSKNANKSLQVGPLVISHTDSLVNYD